MPTVLALDPVMRQVGWCPGCRCAAASASKNGAVRDRRRWPLAENRAALADLKRPMDRPLPHDRNGLKFIVLDMDTRSARPMVIRKGTAWNGHFLTATCYHPTSCFNQFGNGLERSAPCGDGNVHSATPGRMCSILSRPIMPSATHALLPCTTPLCDPCDPNAPARRRRVFLHQSRLPPPMQCSKERSRIADPTGRRPSLTKVKRIYEDIEYQAQSWDKPRPGDRQDRMHPAAVPQKVGFIDHQ